MFSAPVDSSSGQLRFFPHSTYNQSFFLLRVPLNFNDQPAQIASENRHLTLGCCNPLVNITFDHLITEVDSVVNKYGLEGVSNYWCEDVPLFELKLSSQDELRRFLRSVEKVQNELASRIAATLTQQQQQNLSDPIVVYACVEVFMLTPLPESKDARVIRVTSENLTTCTTIWRESEVFNFASLFQALKADFKGIPKQGKVTLALLDLERYEIHEWFILGLHLGIPPAKLQSIKNDHTLHSPVQFRIEMLSEWMKKLPGPSWSHVVQALMAIGRESLAHKIALKYGVPVPTSVEKKLGIPSQMSMPLQQELSSQVEKLRMEVETKDRELEQKNQALEEARRQKYAIKQRLTQTEQTIGQSRRKTLKLIEQKVEVKKQLVLREQELQSLHERHQDSEKLLKIISSKEEEIQELQQRHTQMKLIQEKMEIEKQLQLRELELRFLHASHQDSDKLQSIIRNKEEEIRELQQRLHTVESELASERKVTQDLKEKLHLATAELAEKSALAQEQEKANRDLKTQLERERQRIDHLFMQLTSASSSRDQYSVEVELQLSSAKLQSENNARQIKQHKVLIDQREEEIKSLSQQIQKMETLIQELEQESARTMDSSTEQQLELEEHILRVTGEAADLRDKLEEVKEENWEAAREIGAAQVENEVLQGWMVELRTQTRIS